GSIEPILNAASNLLTMLNEERSPDTLARVADGLKEFLGKDVEIEARVESWLCHHLLKEGFPNAALERIGDEPQPCEHQLTPHMRSHLWTERSNALRMCGRGREAIDAAEAVIADLEAADEPVTPELRRNLGTLYRDAGRHEQALEIFLNLLPEADRKFRLSLLDSISVTYISLRRPEKAEPYLEEMASLARGPQAGSRIAILATLAAVKSTVGEQRREALTLLRQIPIDEADDLEALLPYASAW